MGTEYRNSDGLQVWFGLPDPLQGRQPSTVGSRKELKVKCDFNDLPLGAGASATGARTDADVFIPSGATIENAAILVGTAWTGGTSLSVGLYQKGGTAIAATGLVNAQATAGLTANTRVAGGGGSIGTTLTQDAYIGATVSGTYTAGTGTLLITYIE